jgi:E3 ubiquitin-protein ligase TRIP12
LETEYFVENHQVLPGSLPVCVPENVHDVKLADADESSIASVANDNQTQLSSGSSIRDTFSRGAGSAELRKPSSRGAMSFAAAAMAGLASVGSHGIRGSRDRRGLSLGASAHERSNKLVFTTVLSNNFYKKKNNSNTKKNSMRKIIFTTNHRYIYNNS